MLKPARKIWNHPASPWLVGAATVGSAAAWLIHDLEKTLKGPVAVVVAAVEVPIRPVGRGAGDRPGRVTLTARWGFPGAVSGAHSGAPPQPNSGAPPQADRVGRQQPWDGYLSLDCGDVDRVQPLGLEVGALGLEVGALGLEVGALGLEPDLRGAVATARTASVDQVGPVVRGETGDSRIYWRSNTGRDWDGVQVQLSTCRDDGSTVRIVTPTRSYSVRLGAGEDDFVSLKAGVGGATLDVHVAGLRDARAVRGARITLAPADPMAPVAEAAMPSDDSAVR